MMPTRRNPIAVQHVPAWSGRFGLAPDEYAALTMVLLRLLAFKPSAAAAWLKKKR
jgi:hypothetical protein